MHSTRSLLVLAALAAACPKSAPAPATSAPTTSEAVPTAAEPAATTEAPPAEPVATEAPVAQPAPVLTPAEAAKQRHEQLAEKARAAVVAGDLEAFRVALDDDATQPLPGEQPNKAAVFVARAKAGAKVADLPAAATALGPIGASCAGCHRVQTDLEFATSRYEEGDANLSERMKLHWWATDAMWRGLVGPSDIAWDTGARSLADADLTAVPGFPKGGEAAGYAFALRGAAADAQRAKGDETRGRALGRVIATCSGCHTALGSGPSVESP